MADGVLVRLLTSAFALIVLSFVLTRALGQELRCNDAVPQECKTPRFLGEERGCACFECNPCTPQAKVVCTRDPEKKKTLWALVPPP